MYMYVLISVSVADIQNVAYSCIESRQIGRGTPMWTQRTLRFITYNFAII